MFIEQHYLDILEEVKYYAILSLDYSLSKWKNAEALIFELNALKDRLRHRDIRAIRQCVLLFSNSGALSSLSQQNGWMEQFQLFSRRAEQLPLPTEILSNDQI